jgi:hypothetical protein
MSVQEIEKAVQGLSANELAAFRAGRDLDLSRLREFGATLEEVATADRGDLRIGTVEGRAADEEKAKSEPQS